jgi:hypothetical protein
MKTFKTFALCVDCWHVARPERPAPTEQRQRMAEDRAKAEATLSDDEQWENRCPCCEERIHDGIYVRMRLEELRALRAKREGR